MKILTWIFLYLLPFTLLAQGLEGVIVEEYFTTTNFRSMDSSWPGSDTVKTFRIYVDLEPGYKLQAVFGNKDHELLIESSGLIYNHPVRGFNAGNLLNDRRFNDGVLMLDSYLTVSTISNSFAGVLKEEDTDGSIIKEFQGNIIGNEFLSFLEEDGKSKMPISSQDGMTASYPNNVQFFRLDADVLANESIGKSISTNDGCWAVLGGVEGPTPENRVLIAQITTDGELSFKLNLQLGIPDGGSIQFVAENAKGNEESSQSLIRK